MLSLVLETELTWKCSWKTKQSKQSRFSLVTSEPCQSGFHLHIICRLKEGDIPTPVCLPTLGMHLNVLPRALVMPQKQFLVVLFTPHPVQSNSLLKNINPFRHMPNLHVEVCPSSFSARLTPTLQLWKILPTPSAVENPLSSISCGEPALLQQLWRLLSATGVKKVPRIPALIIFAGNCSLS